MGGWCGTGKDEGSIFVTRSGGQLAGVVVLIMYATVRCGKGIVKLCRYDDEEDEEEGHAGLNIAEGVKGRQRVGGWDGWDGMGRRMRADSPVKL